MSETSKDGKTSTGGYAAAFAAMAQMYGAWSDHSNRRRLAAARNQERDANNIIANEEARTQKFQQWLSNNAAARAAQGAIAATTTNAINQGNDRLNAQFEQSIRGMEAAGAQAARAAAAPGRSTASAMVASASALRFSRVKAQADRSGEVADYANRLRLGEITDQLFRGYDSRAVVPGFDYGQSSAGRTPNYLSTALSGIDMRQSFAWLDEAIFSRDKPKLPATISRNPFDTQRGVPTQERTDTFNLEN